MIILTVKNNPQSQHNVFFLVRAKDMHVKLTIHVSNASIKVSVWNQNTYFVGTNQLILCNYQKVTAGHNTPLPFNYIRNKRAQLLLQPYNLHIDIFFLGNGHVWYKLIPTLEPMTWVMWHLSPIVQSHQATWKVGLR